MFTVAQELTYGSPVGAGAKSADDQKTGHWLRASRNKNRVFGILVARVTLGSSQGLGFRRLYSLQLCCHDVNPKAPSWAGNRVPSYNSRNENVRHIALFRLQCLYVNTSGSWRCFYI